MNNNYNHEFMEIIIAIDLIISYNHVKPFNIYNNIYVVISKNQLMYTFRDSFYKVDHNYNNIRFIFF